MASLVPYEEARREERKRKRSNTNRTNSKNNDQKKRDRGGGRGDQCFPLGSYFKALKDVFEENSRKVHLFTKI